MLKKFSFLILLVFIFPFCVILGQGENMRFELLDVKKGLSDNYVFDIVEDSYGYVWIATKEGLNKFDGYTFKQYKHDRTNTNSLIDNYIWSVYEDSLKQLWVCSLNGGLMLYDRTTDSFSEFLFERAEDVPQNGVRRVLQYNDSLMFIGTMHGVCKYNMVTKKQTFISIQNTSLTEVGDNDVSFLFKDSHDNLWVGYEFGQGLCRYDFSKDSLIQFQLQNDRGKNIHSVNRIVQFNDSLLWIGSYETAVMQFNIANGKSEVVDIDGGFYKGIFSMKQFSDSTIWVGSSSNRGIKRFSLKDSSVTLIKQSADGINGMSSLSVFCSYEDSYGNLWFGTHGGGVNFYNKRKNNFKSFVANDTDNSLSNNIVSCFLEDSNGNYWIGTDGGGLNYWNVYNNAFEKYNVDHGLTGNAVLDLVFDEYKKGIYVATWNDGVFYFDITEKRFYPYTQFIDNAHDMGDLNVKGITRKDDSLFIATHFDGVYVLLIESKRLLTRSNFKEPLNECFFTEQHSHKLREDSYGNKWVTNSRGLMRYHSGECEVYYSGTTVKTLPSNYVVDVYEDRNNRLWIGTSKGICMYDNNTNTFNRLDVNYNLDLSIKSFIEDSNGFIWCGTSNGLLSIDPDTFSWTLFSTKDGLLTNQFFERAVYRNKKGELLFGTVEGFVVFTPQQFVENVLTPKIYLTSLSIFNEEQIPRGDGSVLETHINDVDLLYLNHNQNFIEIGYVGLGISVAEKTKYRYKMSGLEEEWNYAKSERIARYTSIPPGKYVFEVQATDSNGEWQTDSTPLSIVVLSPWWSAWWFRILLGVLLIAFVFAIYYIRTRHIKKTNKRLANEVELRTKALNVQNLELLSRNEQVRAQSELINKQKNEVQAKAEELKERNAELQNRNEEIVTQRDLIAIQNDELETLNKSKDRLISIIGHDLKNPLNGIMGFADLLLDKYESLDSERIVKYISFIKDSSDAMHDLLQNLLNWAQTQSRNYTVIPKKLHLLEMVKVSISLYQNICKKKNVELLIGRNDMFTAFADFNMVDAIIRNLINNAIKFTQAGGTVSVDVYQENGMAVVAVADTGIGMDETMVEKLLNGSNKKSETGTDNEKGTGLGFQICLDFAHKNRGCLAIDSEQGKGTVIKVYLHINEDSFNNADFDIKT